MDASTGNKGLLSSPCSKMQLFKAQVFESDRPKLECHLPFYTGSTWGK